MEKLWLILTSNKYCGVIAGLPTTDCNLYLGEGKMRKEIPFQEGKVIFFKESNFWNDLLERCKRETKAIYIATYNFNFRDKYERTFYKQLSNLANSGIDVNLLYSKMTFSDEDKLEIEDIFKNFVLCAELTTNHSKLFITDDFAFIGSANFSFGSNNNYESGVIFSDKEIISELRKFYCEELLEKVNLQMSQSVSIHLIIYRKY